MSHKRYDFGYFGKGIDGYVHYKQAFDRNFPKDEQDDLQSDLYSEMMRPKANPPKIRPAMTQEEIDANDLAVIKAVFFIMVAILAVAAIICAIAVVACMIWMFLVSLPVT